MVEVYELMMKGSAEREGEEGVERKERDEPLKATTHDGLSSA